MALTKLDIANAVEGITAVANGGTGRSSDNRGRFQVYSGADQSVGSNSTNLVNLNTKVFDLDSYFNTSTYRYVPQVEGYYYIECKLHWRPDDADDNVNLASYLFKNGNHYHSVGASPYLSGNTTARPIGQMCMKVGAGKEVETDITSLVYFNGSSDYIDLRGYIYNYTNASSSSNHMMGHATLMVTYMLGYRVS
jgi:hypothetical protein